MAEGVKRLPGADYENFIGNVPFLKGWPVFKLSETPASCTSHYYSPGQVIVKDSNDSDWIYIVKSGSVSVMKKLDKVVPRRSVAYERQLRLARKGLNVIVPFKERRRRCKLLAPLKLPEVPRPQFHSQFELQMKMDQTIPGAYKENDRLGILDYDKIFNEYRGRLRAQRVAEVSSSLHHGPDQKVGELHEAAGGLVGFGGPPVLPGITQSRGVYMSARSSRKSHAGTGLSIELHDLRGNDPNDTAITSDLHKEALRRLPDIVTSGPNRSGSPADSVLSKVVPSTIKPLFILVQVLEKGQYFGVGNVVFRETQPSLSVVANRAECILLSKSFFRQHSTEDIINNLRKTEVPYPTDTELQEKLQEDTHWRSYRADIYRQVVHPVINTKARRHQYTINYKGQYNFRSGPV